MGCWKMTKNRVEVIIGGQVYTLQGSESEEHIQRVARVLDEKVTQIQKNDSMRRLSTTQKHMMAALNMADDYLKMKSELDRFSAELGKCSAENLALLERMEEMSLEINRLKMNKRRK